MISALRVNAPMRMLVDMNELDIQYSNIVIALTRDYLRRSPELAEAFTRAYLEGVAATHNQKDRAFKVIQKYTRLKDQRLIEELYTDSVKFLERVPRVEPEAIAPIVEFMGKKPIPVETFETPLPSRSTATSMSVSLVARLTAPLRPPLRDFAGGRAELLAMIFRPRAIETAFCVESRPFIRGPSDSPQARAGV